MSNVQVRYNTRSHCVEMRADDTAQTNNLQKGADFVKAFVLGFEPDVRSLFLLCYAL